MIALAPPPNRRLFGRGGDLASSPSLPIPAVQPKGIFGNRSPNEVGPRPSEREAAAEGRDAVLADLMRNGPQMPGPISGFGGGTFDMDGSQVTPVQRGAPEDEPVVPWTNEGFEGLRSALPSGEQHGSLGGSMREPFDYDAALAKMAGDQSRPKWWQYGLAALGDALAMQNDQQPYAVRSLATQNQGRASRMQDAIEQVVKWRQADYARMHEADLQAAGLRTVGRNVVQYDPGSGQTNVLYDGPEDWDEYANDLGLEPGSPAYFTAAEDFVLRGNGPSAHTRDLEMDDRRTSNDRGLEAYRQSNRVSLEEQRQQGRRGMVDYRNANPPPARPRAPRANIVSVKTPQEAMALPSGTKFRTPDGKVKVRP